MLEKLKEQVKEDSSDSVAAGGLLFPVFSTHFKTRKAPPGTVGEFVRKVRITGKKCAVQMCKSAYYWLFNNHE